MMFGNKIYEFGASSGYALTVQKSGVNVGCGLIIIGVLIVE